MFLVLRRNIEESAAHLENNNCSDIYNLAALADPTSSSHTFGNCMACKTLKLNLIEWFILILCLRPEGGGSWCKQIQANPAIPVVLLLFSYL